MLYNIWVLVYCTVQICIVSEIWDFEACPAYKATSADGVLPCFTTNASKMWCPAQFRQGPHLNTVQKRGQYNTEHLLLYCDLLPRWLSAAEKGSLLGFPLLESTANAYGCQRLFLQNLDDPHACFGNTMHVPNVGGVILAALLSIQLFGPQHSNACGVLSALWCCGLASGMTWEEGPTCHCN